MSGGHPRAARECLDVQRLRVVPVHPVADATEAGEIEQSLFFGGGGHGTDRATARSGLSTDTMWSQPVDGNARLGAR